MGEGGDGDALYGSGRVVGRIEVAHALNDLIVGTAFAALLGLLLGGVVYGIYRTGPQRALRKMAAALGAEQTALFEREKNYRAMVEWSPEPIAVHRNGMCIYVNPAAIRMFGASDAQDLVGVSLIDLIHPDSRLELLARLKNLAEGAVNTSLTELKYNRLDSKVIYVETQGTLIAYEGAPAVHVSMRDVTERRQTAAVLAAAQHRSAILAQLGRDLAEAATPKAAATHILEAAQQLFKWDASWLQLWDEPRQIMTGLAYFDLIDGEVRDVSSAMVIPQTPTPLARRVMEQGPQLLLFDSHADAGAIGQV